MAFPRTDHDPDSRLDYVWDWSAWLTGAETISSVAWVVPTGITNDANSHTTTTATIWLTGGTAGTTYVVTCRITTSAGRTDDRSRNIHVVQR